MGARALGGQFFHIFFLRNKCVERCLCLALNIYSTYAWDTQYSDFAYFHLPQISERVCLHMFTIFVAGVSLNSHLPKIHSSLFGTNFTYHWFPTTKWWFQRFLMALLVLLPLRKMIPGCWVFFGWVAKDTWVSWVKNETSEVSKFFFFGQVEVFIIYTPPKIWKYVASFWVISMLCWISAGYSIWYEARGFAVNMTRKSERFKNTFPLDGDFMVIVIPMVEGAESWGFHHPKHSIYGTLYVHLMPWKLTK